MTLLEAGPRLGGTLQIASIPYEPNERLLRWQRRQLAATAVTVKLDTTATAATLRALGATRSQLARSQRIELWAVGGLAGLLAAAGATAIAWALSTQVFDFTITLSLWPWLAGIVAGMLGAWAGGALALRGVLRTPPLVTLRET